MPTRNEIIEQLFTGKNFNDCISRMEPEHLRADLKQEVITIVCSWPEEKVIGLWERNELDFFVVRVILNQIQSSTSPFYKKFRDIKVEYLDNLANSYLIAMDLDDDGNFTRQRVRQQHIDQTQEPDYTERQLREELEDHTFREIERLPFYYCEIIKLYMKEKTFRAMETRTTIPYSTCFKSVQKGIEMLRRRAEIWENPVMTRNIEKYENGK